MRWLFLLAALLLSWPFQGPAQEQHKRQLKQVRQQLSEEQKRLKVQQSRLQQLENQLRQTEKAEGEIAARLNLTKRQLQRIKERLSQLQTQIDALRQQATRQQQLLATTLRGIYLNGRHDLLKMLLNLEQIGELERQLRNYQYLADARVEQIHQLKQTLTRLAEQQQQHALQQQQLQQLLQQQQHQRQQLQAAISKRQQAHKQLLGLLKNRMQRISRLRRQEQQLNETIRQLQRQQARLQQQQKGLKALKRRLPWPLKGPLLHRYGSRKTGQLRWKGLLIGGRIGQSVQSIADGEVLFADWLKGYGLLMIIDHGKGYMSLYGHNQALLKQPGEHVEAGEPIALVGQSGAQDRPALYFEIRHQGKPLNPLKWLKRRK